MKLYEEELKESDKMGYRDEDGTWLEAGELGVAMLENYIDHYGKDDEWEVIATEQPFRVLVCKPGTSVPWFTMVGILDGVWRYRPNKKLWVPDHKTTAGIGGTAEHPKVPPYLMMDDQAGTYWSFGVQGLKQLGLIPKDAVLSGMLFNFLRKGLPDDRPYEMIKGRKIHLNQNGTVSKRQPAPYFARIPIDRDEYDREYSKERTIQDFQRIELVRSGLAPPLKAPGMFTCGMCGVRDICELHETGNDWESMAASTMTDWDPYADHEIKEGR